MSPPSTGGAASWSIDKTTWWIYGSRFGLILFIAGALLAILYGIIDYRVSDRFHQIEVVMTTHTNAIDNLQKELKGVQDNFQGVRTDIKTTNEILTDVRVSLSHIEGALSKK